MKNARLKKYVVYMDDGSDCFKVHVPASDKKDAESYVYGNGDIIAVKELENADMYISAEKVAGALAAAGFGIPEMDYIIRTLTITGIAD